MTDLPALQVLLRCLLFLHQTLSGGSLLSILTLLSDRLYFLMKLLKFDLINLTHLKVNFLSCHQTDHRVRIFRVKTAFNQL